ncbi:MAG: hypothetical protein R2716_12545 [Microthrixaceae bacterium]
MSSFARIMTIACAVGSAAAAGALFTFSNFTIEGLKRLPPEQGAAAMQAINRQAPNPLFGLILMGTGAGCVVLGIQSAANLDDPGARYRLAACGLYVVGVVILTGTFHVPRNDRLDAFDPNAAEGVSYWATYLTE